MNIMLLGFFVFLVRLSQQNISERPFFSSILFKRELRIEKGVNVKCLLSAEGEKKKKEKEKKQKKKKNNCWTGKMLQNLDPKTRQTQNNKGTSP